MRDKMVHKQLLYIRRKTVCLIELAKQEEEANERDEKKKVRFDDDFFADWAEEAVAKAEILRLIYQGRFLHSNVTLGALGLPFGKTTVMHLVPRENLPEPNSQGWLRKMLYSSVVTYLMFFVIFLACLYFFYIVYEMNLERINL